MTVDDLHTIDGALRFVRTTSPPKTNWAQAATTLEREITRLRMRVAALENPEEAPQAPIVVPVPRLPNCPKTGKRTYRSEDDAINATKGTGQSMRAYRCGLCKGIHTTRDTYGGYRRQVDRDE